MEKKDDQKFDRVVGVSPRELSQSAEQKKQDAIDASLAKQKSYQEEAKKVPGQTVIGDGGDFEKKLNRDHRIDSVAHMEKQLAEQQQTLA